MVLIYLLTVLIRPCLAVNASVDPLLGICKLEYLRQLLFDGGDASRVPALEYVPKLPWELGSLLGDIPVVYGVHRDSGVHISECREIKMDQFVYLYLHFHQILFQLFFLFLSHIFFYY